MRGWISDTRIIHLASKPIIPPFEFINEYGLLFKSDRQTNPEIDLDLRSKFKTLGVGMEDMVARGCVSPASRLSLEQLFIK